MLEAELATTAPLGPECYTSEEWLEQERRRVFEAHWHFAGFRDELRRPGDYVTLRVGRVDLIVRRVDAGLVAFRNVCSHRHARILGEPAGCGPLRCAYHGWTYDDDGYPVGLPGCREDFGLTDPDRRALSLEKHAVDTAGPFVFVHVGTPALSLREYLGRFAQVLDRWNDVFALPFERGKIAWNANWKAAVENTLEPNHGPFVHADSLARVLHTEGEFAFFSRHSSIAHELRLEGINWWNRISEQAQLVRVPGANDYRHYFIYPNLCIGITYGALVSVQTFEPVAADGCLLHYRLLLPQGSDPPNPMREVLQSYLSEFNEKVLLEDKSPVEACQFGYGQTQRRALLARCESRILAMQNLLLEDMTHTANSPGNSEVAAQSPIYDENRKQ